MPDTYEGPSLNTATPEADGPLVFEYPLAKYDAANAAHFIASQVYRVIAGSYAPPTLGSAGPGAASSAGCIGDTEPQKIDGGLVEYTRRWATTPATWSDYDTVVMKFPRILYGLDAASSDRSPPRNIPVPCRIEKVYTATATPSSITILPKYDYSLSYYTEVTEVDFVLIPATADVFTSPPGTAYLALVTAGTEIVAEPSSLERYAGNIWCRTTKYVVAR